MLLFYTIIMRDLIRNYRMIIKNKRRDSDSESEPLMSSSSSSYGCTHAGVFRPDSYSTESENDLKTKSSSSRHYSINKMNQSLKLPSSEYYQQSSPASNVATGTTHRKNSNINNAFNNEACLVGLTKDIKETIPECQEFPSNCNKHTHSSMITIFAIWNTTMGSSLLTLAWGYDKTGLFSGIFINIVVAALCLYTAYILLSINKKHGVTGEHFEVPDLCRLLIGRWAEIVAKIFSVLVLLGANVVYWILMTNFLYNLVHFAYDFTTGNENPAIRDSSAVCRRGVLSSTANETDYITKIPISEVRKSTFDRVWDLYSTVPIFLAVIMFPLLNFRSPTFFTKFNSLGTLSVGYLLVFVAIKATGWGVNLEDWRSEFHFKPTFWALTGMLSLGYFIHNIIISVMRHNKHQENNGRDLTIAFLLITFTYVFIAVLFYVSFPLAKSCIEDNFLNNFSKGDTMSIIARALLLFQLFTVFPLMSFMLRNDILVNVGQICNNGGSMDFSYKRVILINSTILFVCVIFACFLPKIGTLVRYTGALSGLFYIFLLPSLLMMLSLKKEKRLTKIKQLFFIGVIVFGIMNFLMQFFIKD